MENMRYTFTNEEYLDMDFVYEFRNRSAPAAINEHLCQLSP
jgi:hypothetical protein